MRYYIDPNTRMIKVMETSIYMESRPLPDWVKLSDWIHPADRGGILRELYHATNEELERFRVLYSLAQI
jgi:hypothetical protein